MVAARRDALHDRHRAIRGPAASGAPNPTRLWGYGQGPATSFRHLGGVIAAARGTPVQITFRNNLPATHILPVDTTILGAELAHEPHERAPARRPRPMGQRRRPARLVGPERRPWAELGRTPCGNLPTLNESSTTTPTTKARGWSGTTTTPSASPASMPMRESPRLRHHRRLRVRARGGATTCPGRSTRARSIWSSRTRPSCRRTSRRSTRPGRSSCRTRGPATSGTRTSTSRRGGRSGRAVRRPTRR